MSQTIVIDAIPLHSDFTGIAKYTFEISQRIVSREATLDPTFYYGYFQKKLYSPGVSRDAHVTQTVKKKVKKYLSDNYVLRKITREMMSLSSLFYSRVLNREWDLYWEPNTVPIQHMKCKHLVTTVHDLSFHVYPNAHPKERTEYFHKHIHGVCKSDRIITGSQCTKNEIIDFLQFDASRIQVIYHGVDHENFRVYERSMMQTFSDQYRLPDRFVLFVGSIEPRKNLKNALLAYNSLSDKFKREHKFLLAGFSGWSNAEVMEIIRREKGNILYLGYLSDRELAYLYNLASVVIYPSLYEGFGLPPLEAMACGSPVVVSNVSSMPEICGEAAYYADPLNTQSIAESIYTVATDDGLRNNLIEKGLQRVKNYTWDKSTREHVSVFQEVLQS
jgi:glycosyltransferase involved in cell wall biosynthesis